MDWVTAHLGLGANLGVRERSLAEAAARLGMDRTHGGPRSPDATQDGNLLVLRASSVYATAPWGLEEQPEFLNCALEIRTRLTPVELLDRAKAVERDMGRAPAPGNGPRIIDVDILLYGGVEVDLPDLQIPHPRMHLRAFALIPLAELAGDLCHPTLKCTIGELADRVDGRRGVRLWGPPPGTPAGASDAATG